MRRISSRWRTRFGRFVDLRGVPSLRESLAELGCPVDRTTVYKWIHGAASPRVPTAQALVKIARGSISMDDVFAHRDLVSRVASGVPNGERTVTPRVVVPPVGKR